MSAEKRNGNRQELGFFQSFFWGKQLFWIFAIGGLLLDLFSKALVFDLIPEYNGKIPVIDGFFYLARVENPGGVFGFFGEYTKILTVIRAVALVLIVYFMSKVESSSKAVLIGFGALFAGAGGNLYDNLFHDGYFQPGTVRDWLDFYLYPPGRWHFPTFNIADVLINVGVWLLILQEFRKKPAADAPKSS